MRGHDLLGLHANISSKRANTSKTISARTLLEKSASHEETSGEGYKRNYTNREWRKQVTEALYLDNMPHEAELFGHCAERPLQWIPSDKAKLPNDAATVWTCSHDKSHDAALFMATCDLRICPDCAARETARLAARYIPHAVDIAMRGGRTGLRHIVFTTPLGLTSDTPDKISKQVDHYAKLPRIALADVEALGESLGREWKTLGAIQSEEYGTEGLKLHFHVVHDGNYLPQKQLSEAWQRATNNEASVVYVRKIGNSTPEDVQNDVIETLKYSTKFWSTDKETGEVKYLPVNVMPHLLRVLKGRRRIRSWGTFYHLPKPQKDPFLCKECHSEMVRVGTDLWHLWLSHQVTHADYAALKKISFLQYKLANKSGNKAVISANSPPQWTQKDMFADVNLSNNTGHYSTEDNV